MNLHYYYSFRFLVARTCWGKWIQLTILSSALMWGNMAKTHAAIALDRTRVVFDGAQKSVSLSVSNKNKQLPYLAQGWMEDDMGQKIQSPLTVLPPVQRIEPEKSSQIKIQSLPAIDTLPQDKESLYYFNLREIPPKSHQPNTLQIALQSRIKLFYRPKELTLDPNDPPPQDNITLTKQGDTYIVNNQIPYYTTFVDVRRQQDTVGVPDFEPLMVAPHSQVPLAISAVSLGDHPVLTYVNDYGGRPELHFQCVASICKVVPDKP